MNAMDSSAQAGAIIGFAAFGLAFLITVVMIFVDIYKRLKSYEEDIAGDRVTMKELGMDSMMAEIEAELKKRLTGAKVEDEGDDQLLGEASKLQAGQF